MIDVKKLSIGFLILTVAASASALLVGNLGGSASANNNPTNAALAINVVGTDDATPSGTATTTDSAFLPAQTSDQAVEDALDNAGLAVDPNLPSSSNAITDNQDNLTNVLAEAYMTNLISANPDGPTADDNGDQVLNSPDSATVVAELEDHVTSTAMAVAMPDWDAEAAQIPVTTVATSSPNAISNYSSAIQNIFNQDIVQPNIENMLDGNTDPTAGSYVEPKIQTALQDVAGLQTPAPLVNLQKSLITYLVYGENTLALAESVSSSSDPVKTALVLQAESQKYDTVTQNFQNQLQQATALTGFSAFAMNAVQPTIHNEVGVTALVNNMFGIQTANAIFGLGDIDFDPTTFAHTLLVYAENIALQIAKNLIMFTMQKTVLNWIRGSGAPRFIQNWGTTLVTAYTSAAINALNGQFACVNPAYKSQLQVLLKIPSPNSAGGLCAVQFSNALSGSNLTKFYNNFSSGGFVSYMAVFQPGGNLFGSAMDAQDYAMSEGVQNYISVHAQSVANQGWTGEQICPGSGGVDAGTGCKPGDILNGNNMCLGTGNNTYAPQGGNGQCASGQPQTVQPGQVTGQIFNSAVDSSGKLTAAANSIAGLLDAFTTSLLNSIASGLISATTGALENIGSTGSSAGNTTTGTGGQSGGVPISCTPTFQTPGNPYSVTFLGYGGGNISVSNNQVNTSNPTYSWSIPGANPAVGAGPQFTTAFNASGTYTATVTDTNPSDGGVSAQCTIAVPAPSQ